MCGEKSARLCHRSDTRGSPPHVRGKASAVICAVVSFRITPAHAGKRVRHQSGASGIPDHPRTCGEKGCCKFSSRNHSGSPPRMRGKGTPEGEGFRAAGKRGGEYCILLNQRDHPRVCREKGAGIKLSIASMGSPPHVRGKDPVLHLRQCLQVRPDHARHLVHLSFLRA